MQIVNKYTKCSTSYGKCTWRPTTRPHLTCVKMALTKEMKDGRCWWGCEAKGALHCRWECKHSIIKKPHEVFLKKITIEIPYVWKSSSGYISRGNRFTTCKCHLQLCVLCDIIHNNQEKKSILGAPQTEEWIKKTVYKMCVFTFLRANVYLYIKQTAMEIYSDFFEEGNPIICYSTYITGEHYSKWNKLTLEWQTLQDLMEIECWSEGTNVLLRWIISRALSYSVLTVTKKQHTTNMKSAQTAQISPLTVLSLRNMVCKMMMCPLVWYNAQSMYKWKHHTTHCKYVQFLSILPPKS